MPRITDGQLTDRQKEILARVADGQTHDQIARVLTTAQTEPTDRPVTRAVVSMDLKNVRRKMRTATSAQAAARWSEYMTYERAASMLLTHLHGPSEDDIHAYIDHVLRNVALDLRTKGLGLLPR